MSSAAEDDTRERGLKEAESKYDGLAQIGGIAVVFGLIVEVVLTASFPRGATVLEEWGPVFADALIALGVAGEVIFAARARSKAEALKVISDQKVASAKADAAHAHERAASLEKESAILNKEAADLRSKVAARPWSKEQFDAVQDIKGIVTDVGVLSERDCFECWELKVAIMMALNAAGVKVYADDSIAEKFGAGISLLLPDGDDLYSNPLFKALRRAQLNPFPMHHGDHLSTMLSSVRTDIPVIFIGARAPMQLSAPYWPTGEFKTFPLAKP